MAEQRLAEVMAEGACDLRLKPLLGELGDLKRVRSAGRSGSIASRLFRRAWGELCAGVKPRVVALTTTAAALAATRLGDIDHAVLMAASVSQGDIARIRQAAVTEVAGDLAGELRTELISVVALEPIATSAALPAFVGALDEQPRAGVTCPSKPRIILEPPENHAEHCLMVAVFGVILSPSYGARLETVFLAGLAHHFHNAGLPDSGFTGEMLLGDQLEPVMRHFTGEALASLPTGLRRDVEAARAILPDAKTPEGRAFHAADTIDRVMQIAQHLRAAALTMDIVLTDMGLVHEGPVKAFQDRVLAEMALP